MRYEQFCLAKPFEAVRGTFKFLAKIRMGYANQCANAILHILAMKISDTIFGDNIMNIGT
jgi:hypothetical protein